MELTQRLECTEELFSNRSEKTCPEQIGFIGICGTKQPVKKGLNKIGRDPQTCDIILNLNSISRQHAMLNVISNNEYVLMDLDSANKTKVEDKTLKPYIAYPLRNGDTVQFGHVFGVFRLLKNDEDESDLPLTQAVDIPDTPVSSKFMSKLNHVTTVPESPDVSDRDDSFIAPSQPKPRNTFISPSNHFIKTSGKTISIQPVGHKKIDHVYWNSSKKSDSFHLHNSSSINESLISVKSSDTSDRYNIHEQETQIPDQMCNNTNNASIFDANTQIPDIDTLKPSPPNIYNMETQIYNDKVNNFSLKNSTENHINSRIGDKEMNISIFNAETQTFQSELKTPASVSVNNEINLSIDVRQKASNISDDIILFNEIDCHPLEDNFESQAILPPSPMLILKPNKSNTTLNTSHEPKSDEEIDESKSLKKKPLQSDSPKDCDDIALLSTQIIPIKPIDIQLEDNINILPTQKIIEEINDDDDVTDCDDEVEVVKKSTKITNTENDEDVTDCEDDLNDAKTVPNKNINKVNFEYLDTQVLEEDICPKNVVESENTSKCNFEDMLTQIIPEQEQLNSIINIEDLPTQVLEEDVSTPNNKIINNLCTFKIPVLSPKKQKKKDDSKTDALKKIVSSSDIKVASSIRVEDDDSNYYTATQELFDDLCTQKELDIPVEKNEKHSTKDNVQVINRSLEMDDVDKKIEQFVSSLSSQEIRDVVGVKNKVTKLKKMSSDSSDIEITPKKTPLKFMEIDLPNSQEIKTNVTLPSKSIVTKFSSDSESDNESQKNTPIVFKAKKRKTKVHKLDFSKKFDVETLPSKVITRVRKPTDKLLNNNSSKGVLNSILKSKVITDQEDNINTDIINENISRLNLSENSENLTSESLKINKESKSGKKSEAKQTQKESKSGRSSIKVSTDNTVDNHNINETNKTTYNKKENINERSETRNYKKEIKHRWVKDIKEPDGNKNNSESLNEPNRETRGRKKRNVTLLDWPTEIESLPEKRRRTKRIIENIDSSPVKEVRRSRRIKSKKEDNNKSKDSSIAKREQSTVYLSASGVDSPKLKRSASNESLAPNKRRKLRPATALGINLRATPARKDKTQHVLLTAFPSEEVPIKLKELGAVIVTDVKECTVLLTRSIKRTFKLLCAVGLGKPIVGEEWVRACMENKVIVDPWLYLMQDEAAERRFEFNLQRTLVSKRCYLKGYNISSTPSVQPNTAEMKLIVECSGGTWEEGGPNWIVVSSRLDEKLWSNLVKKGAIIVNTEFILSGVLQQKVDTVKYRLACDNK